jgi:hypothetical protein
MFIIYPTYNIFFNFRTYRINLSLNARALDDYDINNENDKPQTDTCTAKSLLGSLSGAQVPAANSDTFSAELGRPPELTLQASALL